MQKLWKILAVCLATTLLMSALFATVAAEGLGESDPSTGDTDNPIPPDQPDAPDEPGVNPDEPDTPDQPDEPENPDQPDEPDTPDQPDEPENPDQPDEPENPDQPDEPENPDQPDTTTGEPSTNPSDEPTGDPIAPRPTYTDPIAPIRPTEPTETTDATTSTAPTESVTAPSHSAPPAVKEDAKEEEFPFDVRTTVIYSLVALVIMVAGGVAIYIITKHKSNPQQRH